MRATKACAALDICAVALAAFIEHDCALTRRALEARQRFREIAAAELGAPATQQPAATPAGAA